MGKKILIIFLCIVLLAVIAFGITLYLDNSGISSNKPNTEEPNEPDKTENTNIPSDTESNDQIISTNSNSTIRVINYYDETMFKGKNTILFMWASWCPNCAEEMDDLNEILKKYKNDQDVNIVFIAHEYRQEDGNIDSLLELLEGGTVDFDTEILLDYGRVIRKHIDPEEGYIPRTYFLDKDCNVLEELEHAVTVDEIEQLINKYYKNN